MYISEDWTHSILWAPNEVTSYTIGFTNPYSNRRSYELRKVLLRSNLYGRYRSSILNLYSSYTLRSNELFTFRIVINDLTACLRVLVWTPVNC